MSSVIEGTRVSSTCTEKETADFAKAEPRDYVP